MQEGGGSDTALTVGCESEPESRMRAGLLTTSTSADDYSEAEPLGGFCIRRPQTHAWCGGGIALSHQRAGCSAVSAGGTAGHARSLGSRSVVVR